MVYRIFVEKKAELAHEAGSLLSELRDLPGLEGLSGLRVINRYDVENIDAALFEAALRHLSMHLSATLHMYARRS